ncbi:MAG TPA: phytanoyl-CoA dioxygenase family protein [Candidatus Sulfotelmatobacter sp.]|nr:phytanoyl-CoA dioxygenase family protein [Candidatus Sulfotelmatobacter sp.]
MQSPTVRRAFRDDGLQSRFDAAGFVIIPCLDANRVARLRAAYDAADTKIINRAFSASLMSDEPEYRARVNTAIFEACTEPLAEILDDYRISYVQFFTKRSGTAHTLPLHQDPTFLDESRFESLNFWIPLVDVSPANSCLRVVPGSHRLNRQLRSQLPRFPYPELVEVIERRFLYDCTMPAGYACVMSARLIHGSHANMTPHHRMAASAVAVPVESDAYYIFQRREKGPFEAYAVAPDFHRTHPFGTPPPDSMVPFLECPYAFDPIDEGALERVVAEAGLATAV